MSRDTSTETLIYWLIPAEPARGYLQTLIGDLARRFDAESFEPHVTLYGTDAAGEDPGQVLENAVASLNPLRLSVAGIEFSDKFTKTLFVQFRPDLAVTELSDRLRFASVSQRAYELNPHLSLIYKKLSDETKLEIKDSLKLPFDEVHFDSVKAIISPGKVESSDDVKRWRAVASKSLDQ